MQVLLVVCLFSLQTMPMNKMLFQSNINEHEYQQTKQQTTNMPRHDSHSVEAKKIDNKQIPVLISDRRTPTHTSNTNYIEQHLKSINDVSDQRMKTVTANKTRSSNVKSHTPKPSSEDEVQMDSSNYNNEPVFESVPSRRTRRYYIGGISSYSNREGLLKFLKSKNISPVAAKMIDTNRGNLAAKLTLYQSDSHIVEVMKFWPGKMYCRRWYSQAAWDALLYTYI